MLVLSLTDIRDKLPEWNRLLLYNRKQENIKKHRCGELSNGWNLEFEIKVHKEDAVDAYYLIKYSDYFWGNLEPEVVTSKYRVIRVFGN